MRITFSRTVPRLAVPGSLLGGLLMLGLTLFAFPKMPGAMRENLVLLSAAWLLLVPYALVLVARRSPLGRAPSLRLRWLLGAGLAVGLATGACAWAGSLQDDGCQGAICALGDAFAPLVYGGALLGGMAVATWLALFAALASPHE